MSLRKEVKVGLAERPVAFNQDVRALTPSPDVAAEFLVLALQSDEPEILAMVRSAGNGTGVLPVDLLRAYRISVPSLDEQRRFAAVIATVDEVIQAKEAERKALTQTRIQALEHVMSLHLERFGSARIGAVLTERKRPVQVDDARLYHQIGIRSFGRGVFTKEPVAGASLGAKRVFWVEPGDLVINIVFAWEGALAVVPPTIQGYCGSHRFPTYVRNDHGPIEYVRQFLLSSRGMEILNLSSPGGAGRNRTLNRGRLLSFEMPAAPLAEQCVAADAILGIEAQIAAVASEAQALRAARRNMVRAVMSGEVVIDAAVDDLLATA